MARQAGSRPEARGAMTLRDLEGGCRPGTGTSGGAIRSPFRGFAATLHACSREPCPMCLSRLLVAGVETVKFLAPDEPGRDGRPQGEPAAWRRLWRRQGFVRADVSEGLRRFALDVFLLNLEAC